MSGTSEVNVAEQRTSQRARIRRVSAAWVVAVACAAQFLLVLNTSIVNVALSGMQTDLGLSASMQQWVVDGFLVTFGGFLLLAARVGDRIGERAVFIAGLLLFIVASLAGGAAQDSGWLLAARFAQGVGASAMAPATISLILKSPMAVHVKTRSLAFWSVASSAGGGAGLILGGLLTSWWGWRSVLYIDVPAGLLLLIAAVVYLPPRAAVKEVRPGLDVPGAITVTLGSIALIYALSAAVGDGWASGAVVVPLIAAVLLLGAFVLIETRTRDPLVPFRIFQHRPLSIANVLMVTVGITLTSSLYFLSLYEEQVLGYSPLTTGLTLAPMNVMFIVGGLLSRGLMARFGPRLLLIVGAVAAAIGMAWSATITADSTYVVAVLGPTLLIGAGLSIMFVPVVTAATIGIDHAHAGVASGLVNTSRQIGGAIGLAVLVTVAASFSNGSAAPAAVVDGYRVAFLIAAAVSIAAAAVAAFLPGKPKFKQSDSAATSVHP